MNRNFKNKDTFMKLIESDMYIKSSDIVGSRKSKQSKLLKSYGFSPVMICMIKLGIIKYSIK